MQTKEVKYHDIKTRFDDDLYNHGEIRYLNKMKCESGGYMFKTVADIKFALRENDVESFEKELTTLIEKYAQ